MKDQDFGECWNEGGIIIGVLYGCTNGLVRGLKLQMAFSGIFISRGISYISLVHFVVEKGINPRYIQSRRFFFLFFLANPAY